jgi:hypothetical protein
VADLSASLGGQAHPLPSGAARLSFSAGRFFYTLLLGYPPFPDLRYSRGDNVSRLARIALIPLLALALCNASVQAKRGLYAPERSAAGITAKVIKLAECRLEHVAAELPAQAPIILLPPALLPEPRPAESISITPRPLVLTESLRFRPPPALL